MRPRRSKGLPPAPGARAVPRRSKGLPPAPGARAVPRLLARRPGRFGPVFVVEEGGVRLLRFGTPDAEDQSAFDPAHPKAEPLAYIQAALAALAWAPTGRARPRVLVIGLGGGAFLRHAHRLRPFARLEAVEIDPVVPPLARRWFGLRSVPVSVHVADGRAFLAHSRARYDLIFVDAYDADDYPRHLGTRFFFRLLARRLTPRGVAVANLSPNRLRDRDDLVRTFGSVFGPTLCYEAPPGGNTLVFGGPGVRRGSPSVRRRQLAALARRAPRLPGLGAAARSPCRFSLARAHILRDAPVRGSARSSRPWRRRSPTRRRSATPR